MTKTERITTPYSYSSAVAVGDFIFLGLHRGSGDDFTTQFDNTFKYMQKTLAEVTVQLAGAGRGKPLRLPRFGYKRCPIMTPQSGVRASLTPTT